MQGQHPHQRHAQRRPQLQRPAGIARQRQRPDRCGTDLGRHVTPCRRNQQRLAKRNSGNTPLQRAQHLHSAGKPLCRRQRQRPEQRRFHGGADPQTQGARRHQHIGVGPAFQGRGRLPAGQRMVERRAQAVEIAARLGVLSAQAEMLGRSVLRRPHPTDDVLRLRAMRVPQLHQPEIHQHRSPVGGPDDDVLGLDVAVKNVPRVASVERIQQLKRPTDHLLLGQGALPLNQLV